jgi:hypothetical protein
MNNILNDESPRVILGEYRVTKVFMKHQLR